MRHIIRNAMVFDGTGSPSVAATVVVDGDRIAAVVAPGDAVPARPGDVTAAGWYI